MLISYASEKLSVIAYEKRGDSRTIAIVDGCCAVDVWRPHSTPAESPHPHSGTLKVQKSLKWIEAITLIVMITRYCIIGDPAGHKPNRIVLGLIRINKCLGPCKVSAILRLVSMCDPLPGHAGSDYNVGFAELKSRCRFKLGKVDLQRKVRVIALELEVLHRN